MVCGGGNDERQKTAYLGFLVRGAVYVFGSIGCAAGERLAVQTGELLDMHTARWNFNATVWKGAIFLCQGSVDVFDGHNKLSAGLISPEGWNTISYACGKSLLILSKSHFVVLEMRENRPAIVRKETHREASVASHPTPVLFRGQLIGLENGKVCRYSLENGNRLE